MALESNNIIDSLTDKSGLLRKFWVLSNFHCEQEETVSYKLGFLREALDLTGNQM